MLIESGWQGLLRGKLETEEVLHFFDFLFQLLKSVLDCLYLLLIVFYCLGVIAQVQKICLKIPYCE